MNIIGLKRGTVEVVPYRSEWKQFFNEEKNIILNEIRDFVVDIQHVGSTAVPGLKAKPIIDIAIAINSRSVIPEISRRLETIRYIDRGDGGKDGGYLFIKELAPEVRTIHLHVMEISDPQWKNYLDFRNILQTDKSLRARYANLKDELKKQYSDDRKSYTSGKNVFIENVLEEINEKEKC
ncbi:GrpB family protein [Dehalococcoidia bacterium]|nr:GrpB family protein [Dehalococcoidia bacterium]